MEVIKNALPWTLLVLLLVGFTFCGEYEDSHFYGSATAVIISVDKDDVIGSDYKTTVVFEDGQVETIDRLLGDKGDRLFFESVKMKRKDSTITYISPLVTIKNVTKGYAQYGE